VRSGRESGKHEAMTRCVFELVVEQDRPAYSGSTNHSIRSAFKRATELAAPGHNSIAIWKAFVCWEASLVGITAASEAGKEQSAKKKLSAQTSASMAKEACYASLRACPWSKELCMLGFTQPALRAAIGDEGSKQIYQNMLDRGMRLRIDIPDSLL